MKILDRDNPILRQKAQEVPVSEIKSPKIQKIIARMKRAVHMQDDGVAIAAPQIGESLRIFAVKSSIINDDKKSPDLVFINPKIIKKSQKKNTMEEGCLSVRWLYGEVLRHEKISIQGYTEDGEEVRANASGLLAQIFQHEIDHLDGVLFIDKAKNIRDLPPNEQQS